MSGMPLDSMPMSQQYTNTNAERATQGVIEHRIGAACIRAAHTRKRWVPIEEVVDRTKDLGSLCAPQLQVIRHGRVEIEIARYRVVAHAVGKIRVVPGFIRTRLRVLQVQHAAGDIP